MNFIDAFENVLIPILTLVNFGFILYLVIRVRQLEKRVNSAEANFIFIRDMLIEIDSKLITLGIDDYIKEKLSDVDDPSQLNKKEIVEYIQKLINKHNEYYKGDKS